MSIMPIIPGIEDFGTVTFITSSTESGGSNPTTISGDSFGVGTTNDLLVYTISWNKNSRFENVL